MKSKKKMSVCLEGTKEIVGIIWYGDIRSCELEKSIKKAFELPANKSVLLKDSENDIIVITDSIPLTQVYTVIYTYNP